MGLSFLARATWRRRITQAAAVLLAVLALAAAIDGARLMKTRALNASIAAAEVRQVPDDAPPELRFAVAHAMAASGSGDAAIDRYRSLQGDSPLGQAARYNAANLLLRQAITVRAGLQPGQAIPLIELAKEGYRDVLRRDPAHWPARYNLERAQRLWPDPEGIDSEPAEARRNAERAATTMRGYSPGLP